ncbi:MAG: TCP-1/cpn60 chaperonin family protein, partial [Armatimonadota bacterium]|nr:TCP-1/cpn60 chaperonin family protein [Armatimonadota bacterium]
MSSNIKQVSKSADVDERLAALFANASAVRAVASSVEGTLGPKGLNCMLVDKFGDVTITNDGSTILEKIDVNHPAARLVIRTAKAQDEEVGDGTTTAAILASALVMEGVSRVSRGVPVTKIIQGISVGMKKALEVLEVASRQIKDFDDPLLWQAAYIAGREDSEIADLVVGAAKLVGKEALIDPAFKFADTIVAKEGAQNEVFTGLVVDKERMNRQMPRSLEDVKVLIIDDALEPEQIEDDALATESGFARYVQLQNEFSENLRKIVDLGVSLVITNKGVADLAEEFLTDAGIMVLRRVSTKDIARIVEHTGAKTIKRAGLKKSLEELSLFVGRCARVYEDEKLEHTRIIGGAGKPAATILVGAATREVRDERERIARDAASAVQAAFISGVVPGGGSIEIAASREVSALRDGIKGMAAYGADCVAEALKKPLSQIVTNAGFNPLEKVEDVIAAQSEQGKVSLAIECDTGEVADMWELGVVDPLKVKVHALKAAAEIADAVLRINTIIKKRDDDVEA